MSDERYDSFDRGVDLYLKRFLLFLLIRNSEAVSTIETVNVCITFFEISVQSLKANPMKTPRDQRRRILRKFWMIILISLCDSSQQLSLRKASESEARLNNVPSISRISNLFTLDYFYVETKTFTRVPLMYMTVKTKSLCTCCQNCCRRSIWCF